MQTLNAAADWFLEHCADHRKLSAHTLKAYRRDLDHLLGYITKEPGTVPLALINCDLDCFAQEWDCR